MAGALHRREENTLETDLVAAQRRNGLPEQLLGMLVARINAADVDLLPLNGDIVGLEDGLDRFGNLGTDTVTYCLSLSRRVPVVFFFPCFLRGAYLG